MEWWHLAKKTGRTFSVSDFEVERIRSVYETYIPSVSNRWSAANIGNQCIVDERHRLVEDLLQRNGLLPLTGTRILDVGCGWGGELARMVTLGADPSRLVGIDLIKERIARAQTKHPNIEFAVANAEVIKSPDDSFDVVMLFTVFSSIQELQMARSVASEIRRVLRPGGAILWYDFRYNSPFNPHVRGVTASRLSLLFPGFSQDLVSATVAPPLARRLGVMARPLYQALSRLPFLHTHYVGLLRKPPRPASDPNPVVVDPLATADLRQVAELHRTGFPGYFLSQLGSDFIREYYSEFIDADDACAFVARRNGEVVGFVAGCRDRTAYMRRLYRHRFFDVAKIVAVRAVESPELLPAIWRRLPLVRRAVGSRGHRSSVPARLLSIAVAPEHRGGGVADALVEAFSARMAGSGVDLVGLSVNTTNERAMAFYQKTGWTIELDDGDTCWLVRRTRRVEV